MSNSWRVKTEGDYISPPSHIMDTPLLGYEYVMLQRLLAHSLNLPLPESGSVISIVAFLSVMEVIFFRFLNISLWSKGFFSSYN